MSTYSPSLRIELITTGDQAGTWGTTTNSNLGTLIESAIAGYTSVSITSANQALTALNGAADQSRNMVIALTTTTTAAFNIYAPPAEKTYVIQNASAYSATIYNSTVLGNTTAAGFGVTVPAGKTTAVWSDGTNFAVQSNHLPSLSLATALAIADGGTGATSASAARNNLGLGTMATQTAANVAITGGSITGIIDMAVADGGTGASNSTDARANLDVPSRTGSGASGTWNINITGNAATATTSAACSGNAATVTNGVYASGDQSISGVKSFTGQIRLANGSAGAPSIAFSSDGAVDTGFYWTTDGSINFSSNGVYAGAISAGGNLTMVGNVTAFSDERIKKDWAELPDSFVYDLAKTKYGTYTRMDTGERQAGSSAQAWQKLLPEVVVESPDGHLSLAYGNAALVAAIKLAEKVVELEARLAKLEA